MKKFNIKLVESRRIFFILFFCFMPIVVQATYPGTFDYENQTAYIEVFKKLDPSIKNYTDERILLFVDFANNEISKLATGKNLSWSAINFNGSILSYTDSKGLNFIDSKNGKILWKVSASISIHFWADDRNLIALEDVNGNKKQILEVDFDKRATISVPFEGVIWQISWSKECDCFLYQISNNTESKRRLVKIKDGVLVEQKSTREITASPNNKYFYLSEEYGDGVNTFKINLVGDDKRNVGAYFAQSTPIKINVLWGQNTLRVLDHMSLFDLKNKTLLSRPLYFWNEEIPQLNIGYNVLDLAADSSGFVLKWNDKKKLFEVEDINTGKIVKEYKKFWK